MAVGILVMFVVWMVTTYLFFATGETVLALIALLIPPADLVLPFLISPALGAAGIGGTVVAFIGAAVKGD